MLLPKSLLGCSLDGAGQGGWVEEVMGDCKVAVRLGGHQHVYLGTYCSGDMAENAIQKMLPVGAWYLWWEK